MKRQVIMNVPLDTKLQKSIKNKFVVLAKSKLLRRSAASKKLLLGKIGRQESVNKVSVLDFEKRNICNRLLLERLDAEMRQKQKVEAKKAQADAARKASEERARAIRRNAQETRSSVFAAARQGQSDKVKKGIWEQAVDAAGGEIKPGCAAFVTVPPQDPQETLLHIAVTMNDLQLFEWLDSHSG